MVLNKWFSRTLRDKHLITCSLILLPSLLIIEKPLLIWLTQTLTSLVKTSSQQFKSRRNWGKRWILNIGADLKNLSSALLTLIEALNWLRRWNKNLHSMKTSKWTIISFSSNTISCCYLNLWTMFHLQLLKLWEAKKW
jgi:hypothetical protein